MELRRDQWATVIILACVNMFTSLIYSLQGPFYPQEAQKKGASATEYGLVFGIYELTGLIGSPFVGRIMEKYSLRVFSTGGMMINSIAVILFGLVDLIPGRVLFVATSMILRIIEAIGANFSVVAGFALLAASFEDNLSLMFATLEIFYGCGFILGPVIGGFLYQFGGFSFPFFFCGAIGILTAASIFALYSQISIKVPKQEEDYKMMSALKVPEMIFNLVYMVVFMTNASFVTALLEPHLRQFHLSPSVTALFFITNGLIYALVSPIFGRWVDKGYIKPRVLLFTSCILVIGSLIILGPAPFIPYEATIPGCIIALIMQGFAFAASNVATFTDSFRSARKAGFPDSIATFGLVSGLWYAAFSSGAFLGPTIGGVLYDLVGFRWATLFFLGVFVLMLIVITVFTICTNERKKDKPLDDEVFNATADEKTPLMGANKLREGISPELVSYSE